MEGNSKEGEVTNARLQNLVIPAVKVYQVS